MHAEALGQVDVSSTTPGGLERPTSTPCACPSSRTSAPPSSSCATTSTSTTSSCARSRRSATPKRSGCPAASSLVPNESETQEEPVLNRRCAIGQAGWERTPKDGPCKREDTVTAQHDLQAQPAIEDEIYALSKEKFRWKTEGHFDLLSDLFDDAWSSSTSTATSPPSRSG